MGANRELKSRPSFMILAGIGCEETGAAMSVKRERQIVNMMLEVFIMTVLWGGCW